MNRGSGSWWASNPDFPQEALLADLDKVRSNLEHDARRHRLS